MARLFFPHGWRRLRRECKRSLYCVLILDYDGTLTRIVREPGEAFLSGSMRDLLGRLARQQRVRLGILSGRKLDQLRRLVRLKGIWYAGNHGLEMEFGKRTLILRQAVRASLHIQRLAGQLSKKLRVIAGACVENKGFTLTVHYRKCRASDTAKVRQICADAVGRQEGKRRLRVVQGKKVCEIRPAIEWDKGAAVQWFLHNLAAPGPRRLLVYLGDDTTDEDAFRVVRKLGGWAIRVGQSPKETDASYVVRGVNEVRRFLTVLLRQLEP